MTLTPALSPAFSGARKLSRITQILFAIGFLLMLTSLLGVFVMASVSVPRGSVVVIPGITLPIGSLSGGPLTGAVVAGVLLLLPTVMMLYHACRLFGCFARGEVFAARPIAHMRAAGLWMTGSFFSSLAGVALLQYCGVDFYHAVLPGLIPAFFIHFGILFAPALFIGLATTVAATVMEEARRIAADHAEIV
jgi:hypothetical protein